MEATIIIKTDGNLSKVRKEITAANRAVRKKQRHEQCIETGKRDETTRNLVSQQRRKCETASTY